MIQLQIKYTMKPYLVSLSVKIICQLLPTKKKLLVRRCDIFLKSSKYSGLNQFLITRTSAKLAHMTHKNVFGLYKEKQNGKNVSSLMQCVHCYYGW